MWPHLADQLGDAYPGDTAQQQEDNAMGAPMDPSLQAKEYQFVVANGQIHVSPFHSHDELITHAGQHPENEGPTAVGFVNVTAGHAMWMVETNMSMRGLHKMLEDYSNTVGWDFDGMVGTNGTPLHEDFGPKVSWWYKYRDDGHLLLAQKPFEDAQGIRIVGKTAYLATIDDALMDWAADYGLGLKVADIAKFAWDPQEWNPGSWGKGVIMDGEPLTWRTSQEMDGMPTHADMVYYHHPEAMDEAEEDPDTVRRYYTNPITIAPSGHYTHSDALNFGGEPHGQEHEFSALHSALRYVPNPEMWWKNVERGRYGSSILAEYPGGGDMTDTMKTRENLDVFNRGDTDFQPERSNPDMDLGSNLKCGFCGRRCEDIAQLRLHERAHEPLDAEEIPDGHFPEIDDMDAPLPFRRTQPLPNSGETIAKTAVLVLPGAREAARHPRFELYAKLFHYDHDEGHRFYGAYREGELIGYGTVRLNSQREPEVVMIDVLEHRSGVGSAILGLIQRHYGSFYTHTDSEGGAALLRRAGAANIRGQFWRWAKGSDPKDMIEESIPFVYDAHDDDIHIGYAGQQTREVNHRHDGEFTPGGIVEGFYEPGGKIVFVGTTNSPVSYYHFAQLWYHRFPQMQITTMEIEDAQGKTHKMAAQNVGQYVKTLAMADKAANNAYTALRHAGGKVCVVGGAVRDALQQRQPHDIDLMVAGIPAEQVEHILSSLPGTVKLTGKNFGVYRYKTGDYEVEVALPRTDAYETGRRGEGKITVDHNLPIESDLTRRDFTANSMAIDLDNGDLIDPHGGAKDLEANVLRTTHPNSFREDPTRLVRALVAHSRYGLLPDERTRHEMEANGHLLRGESPDALNKVLDKLFASGDPARGIGLAKETHLLPHLFPEVADNWDFDQNNPHHRHVLGDHLLNVLDNVSHTSSDPDLRLAALYHDVGKPASQWVDPATGIAHYYMGANGEGANHEDVGARMVEDRMRAFNYPKARIQRVRDIVQNHMFPAFSTAKGARRFVGRVGPLADDLLTLRGADMTGKGQTPDEVAERTQVDHMQSLVDNVRQEQQPTDLSNLAINGNDLISMGMQPGPQIGNVLNTLLQEVISDPSLNTPEALGQKAQTLIA